MDKIGKFIIGGERAGDFNPAARVWGEMAVRGIVLRVLQCGLTPAAPDAEQQQATDDDDPALDNAGPGEAKGV